MKKFTLICTALLLAALAFNSFGTRGLMNWLNTPNVARAEISGKDGELTVTTPNTIVNKYGKLAVDAPMGASTITVTNPGGPNGLDVSTLTAGDLILIIQMAGASINNSNSINYGSVTNLNSAGRHEFVTVNQVQGNTITINPPCGGLRFSYSVNGRTQVIRVPQYTKLTINSGASLTAPAWNGVIGGIVVAHVENNAIINGNIDVSGLGFRGGALSNTSVNFGRTDYVGPLQDFGGEKGEGIAGAQSDYDQNGGRYARGAAANGGGGGTDHNSGGGGGANGNNGKTWTGQGVMDGSVTGAMAWTLDPGYKDNGDKLTDSSGGGRGGYSYATADGNALTQGPGNDVWMGDKRREVGGLGGRPVAQDTGGRIFMGGGGGAGAQNNDTGGAGGNGGGLIYIIADSVSGSGMLKANGTNGGDTRNSHRDGAGGGGGGGTIVVAAKTSLSGISAQANGGNGGNQFPPTGEFAAESEGPGGGGGGGYIAYSGGSIATQVNGGVNGTSQAPSVSEFPANGATRGAVGLVNNSVGNIPFCSTTSDLSITKTDNQTTAIPGAPLTYSIVVRNNGPNDVFGIPVVDTLPPVFLAASWTCVASTGSSCQDANGTGSINTKVSLLNGGTATFNLTVTPNPSATGTITNTATVGMPGGAVDPNPNNDTASDTNTLTPMADLSITKTDGTNTVVAGTQTMYTITVRNNGPSTVTGATVSDIVPTKLTNVTWTCTASTGGACGAPSGSGSINTTVDLLPGSTATFKLNATVVNSATGSLSNTATVTAPASVPDPTPANNNDTDVNTITQTVDLAITKTNNATSVVPGTQTTYTIVVTNSGPSAVTGAAVADNLPANLTNATWTCTASAGSACGSTNGTGSINTTADVAVNGTVTYSLTATVSPNATGNVVNTATTAPPPGVVESNSANNSASDTDTLNLVADLSITKSNNSSTVTAGAPTTYTIVARNNGPSSITGATVTDTLPPQLINATWTCTASAGSSCGVPSGTGNINSTVNLAANGTATFTLTATVRSDATGTVSNAASVTAPGGVTDPGGNNNTGTDTDTVVQSSDLSITKSNNATVSAPGTQTTYTIVVSNSGPSAISGATVTDNLPSTLSNASWTCTASAGSSCGAPNGNGNINTTVNLAVGGTATFTLTATISSSATGTITNIATVAPPAGATDPNPANNSASDTDQLAPVADLSITKTNNVTTLVPGTQTTYTIVVANAGPSAVTGATVTDIMPSNLVIGSWTCTASAGSSCSAPNGNININTTVNLAAGGTATFLVNATVASTATGSITNTATVAAPNGTTDPNSSNNSASDTDTLTPTADLAITKSNNGSTVTAGNQVTYTITVTNNGPSAITGATVVDALPAGLTNATWSCLASSGSSCGAPNGSGSINTTVNLANGGAATFTLMATVAADALGTLTNTASVTAPAGATDPSSGNNSASDTDTVISRSNLRIAKTANPTQPIPGSPLTYTIVVTNDGPSPVNGATVTDTVPALLTNVSWTCTASSGSSCGSANGTGNINATVNLANGGTATFTITASVPANTTGTITNTASVAVPQGTTDPESGNNSSTVVSTLQPQSDLSITKVANASVIRAGDQVTYTITAKNNGPSVADNVVVTDPLPTGVTLVSATTTKGTCSGTTTVTCNIGSLAGSAPDNTATVTIKIQVPFTFPVGTLSNSVNVTSSTTDPTGNNNSNTSTVTVNPPPGAQFRNTDITIRVTGVDVCIGSGNVLNVEAKLKNSGDGVQNDNPGSEFTALLPTQLTTVPGTCTSSGGGNCTLGSAQVDWNGSIPVNATVTITFQVRVRQGVAPGTRFCTDYKINYDTNSDNINDSTTTVTNCLTANCTPDPCSGPDCPNVGPGIDINDFKLNPIATGSDQRPGSILVFPLYTSSVANPNSENTRISLTNVHAARPAFLHLFFLDGSNCSVADNFLCLTPNQTSSFLVSDLDPGVTGYLIAVAVDGKGCPINFNYLIGDEYVKLSSGHSANLGAEAIAAIADLPADCPPASSTALMNFDGLKYNLLGRVIAADNLPSRSDGNDTMIIVNRIGGNLGLGATALGSLFGIFYDDTENAVSFTFNSGSCQFRSTISNSFPRITPRFEQFVPAGRSGWVKIGVSGTSTEGALIGAVLNLTSNQNGYTGGHNFHKMTLGTTSLTIPVFPPSCQ
ncbi:MAG: beta strand repeat-containing protein [Blastocatellales bacterium]